MEALRDQTCTSSRVPYPSEVNVGDGTAALAINGQALTSTRTREGVNAVGGSCKETEFEAEHIPTEPFELALTMEKGSGDLNIYDYGLICPSRVRVEVSA